MKKQTSYNKDFFNWSQLQAKYLRENNIDKLDLENLAEEIESLGRSDKRSLRNYLVVLLVHLLKCKYQPERISKSWEKSIINSRDQISMILDDSPSLKPILKDLINNAFSAARREASFETRLSIKRFPEECPWTIEDIIS